MDQKKLDKEFEKMNKIKEDLFVVLQGHLQDDPLLSIVAVTYLLASMCAVYGSPIEKTVTSLVTIFDNKVTALEKALAKTLPNDTLDAFMKKTKPVDPGDGNGGGTDVN